MAYLQLYRVEVGEVGVLPGSVKMVSDQSLATITTPGYLNGAGTQLSTVPVAPSDVIECLYNFNTSTGSGTFTLLTVSISAGVITLSANSGNESLASGYIFVGNAGGVATGVAMSGDATISNTGALTIANSAITNAKVSASAAIAFSKLATLATGHILAGNAGVVTDVTLGGDATIGATGTLTIANNAITTAKILNANVTLAKLASGITPAYVSKFGGQQANGGGSATITITVTGLTTSHICMAQVQASTNAVTVQKVTPTADTLTVILSGDPGANTVIAYQCFLAAS